MKNIGIICEGPTDYIILKNVINLITGDTNYFVLLQPEPDLRGQYGNGWKGVWKWCHDYASIRMQLMDKIQPTLDFLVIQMDGDVSRKEKVSHCGCGSVKCPLQNIRNPLACDIKPEYRNNCPVLLPCPKHSAPVSGYIGTPKVFDPFMVKRNRPCLHRYPLRQHRSLDRCRLR